MELDLSFTRERQALSQGLADFRNQYLQGNEEARAKAREYIDKLVELSLTNGTLTALAGGDLMLCSIDTGPHDENPITYRLPVRVLARAMAAWDQGEVYLPDVFNDIFAG